MIGVKRILFIADPHLQENAPGHQASFEEILKRAARYNVRLVVTLGDLIYDDWMDESLFRHTFDQLARFKVPVVNIPGNHESGNHVDVFRVPPLLTPGRLKFVREQLGQIPWSRDVDFVRILGINSQLLGSNLPKEKAQNRWLSDSLKKARREKRYTVLAMHTPPYLKTPNETEEPDYYWTIPLEPRLRFLKLLRDNPPDLMLAGHIHREITPQCDFCEYRTLASSSFQAHTIWSTGNSRVPPGSDELSFYTLNLDAGNPVPKFERHILKHQDRYK